MQLGGARDPIGYLGEAGVPPFAFSHIAPRALCAHIVRMTKRLIVSDPEILNSTPVFAGTRVPIKNLTDCLEAGDSIDVFLEDFPSVSRAQVIAFLEQARTRLTVAEV